MAFGKHESLFKTQGSPGCAGVLSRVRLVIDFQVSETKVEGDKSNCNLRAAELSRASGCPKKEASMNHSLYLWLLAFLVSLAYMLSALREAKNRQVEEMTSAVHTYPLFTAMAAKRSILACISHKVWFAFAAVACLASLAFVALSV
jgi:hypothetical protein